jgi:hypothetical protein
MNNFRGRPAGRARLGAHAIIADANCVGTQNVPTLRK